MTTGYYNSSKVWTGWATPASMGVSLSGGPSAVYDAYTGFIRVFGRDMNGNLGWMGYPISGTGSWVGWATLGIGML